MLLCHMILKKCKKNNQTIAFGVGAGASDCYIKESYSPKYLLDIISL